MKTLLLVCLIGAIHAIDNISFKKTDLFVKAPSLVDLDDLYDDVPEGRNPCNCPPTTLNANLRSNCVLNGMKREIVRKFWAKQTPKLTSNGLRMKNQILYLQNSDVPSWQYNAYLMTIMTMTLLSSTNGEQKPNFCDRIALINAAVNWETNKDGTEMHNSLDAMVEAYKKASVVGNRNALIDAGCKAPQVQQTLKSCDIGGAMIAPLWASRGQWLPKSYHDLVSQIYGSSNHTDKLMAVTATSTLVNGVPDIPAVKNFNQEVLLTRQNLLQTGQIPSCCCRARSILLSNSSNSMVAEIQKASDKVKLSYPKKTF